MLYVRCIKLGADARLFTDRKIYPAVPWPGRAPGSRLLQIWDDAMNPTNGG